MAPNPLAGIAILTETNLVKDVLNGMLSGFAFLNARGIERDKVLAMLDAAETGGRDLTNAEVAAALGASQDAIDRLVAASGGDPTDASAP